MLSSILTPDALKSNRRLFEGLVWRSVEAQHKISTRKLVDSIESQSLLEEILEKYKPLVPVQCQHLHYLLSTPFRYDSTPPFGSRFRRAGQREAVFYGAERSETAIVEMAFYRLLFFAESPGLNQRGQYSEYTVFSAKVKTGSLIDLSEPPYAPYEQHWSHLSDYLPSQTLADQLRQEHVDGIRYKSVRDISGGRNLALFSCSVFVEPKPVDQQTWRLVIGTTTITAICESTRDFYEIPISQFHADPRLAVITQRT